MNITVNEDLRAYIDPLTPEEHDALERSILAEGCRDALVLWGDVLVDGHNRYGICTKHGLPFQTVQNTRFKSMEDVHLWMIDQHLGRRSVSDFQRGVLALRKKEILTTRAEAEVKAKADAAAAAKAAAEAATPVTPPAEAEPAPAPLTPEERAEVAALASREALARAARISPATVAQIEKIQKLAAPELVEAVKQGAVSINTAATVATLPVAEQVAAVGEGKKGLQQAARQVRDSRKKEREARSAEVVEMLSEGAAPWDAEGAQDGPREGESPEDTITRLLATVAGLRQERAALQAQLAALQA
ncbi:plasmid replication/partition related protein [Aquabacterium sp.]|uniref:plasmid replication/partition related protein n=1 Tax=Aquabacterium sp. TaxID=1872578 RepID=UPI0025C49DD0|nr:plasmid replication/partition related protein [Aquabacterium sp.]